MIPVKTTNLNVRANRVERQMCGKRPQKKQQAGFTLVELMVALILSLIVALAAISALLVSRQGFTAVDAASQLRDNARFATSFISQIALQSGFKDLASPNPTKLKTKEEKEECDENCYEDIGVNGFNDSILPATIGGNPSSTAANGSRSAQCPAGDTACNNGSDILILRYQSAASPVVDGVMFSCMGFPATDVVGSNKIYNIISIFHVALSNNGEPALMCKSKDKDGSWDGGSQPLVEGVESFQVMYGTDGVTPGTTPVVGANDTVPDRYLRADQLTVPGKPDATKDNWRRVRSLRIGLVLRGAPNSAPDRNLVGDAQKLYPLGKNFTTHSLSATSASDDKQSIFTQFPNTGDGRLRQVVTFTVYLHNKQDQ